LKKNKLLKVSTISIFLILILTSAVEAVVNIRQNVIVGSLGFENRGYSTWEDLFNDASKIDPSPPGVGATDNYVIQSGKVNMIGTYAAWTDPTFTKMKMINITNNAGQNLLDYCLCVTILYDSDMQTDFDDLRFKHESNPSLLLSYWIEQKNTTTAIVWVNIPTLPMQQSTMYMFYGNPSASSQSDFSSVFPYWDVIWGSDEKITSLGSEEGSWDPDVSFGNGEFLVVWEEGQPYNPPYAWSFKQEIRGTIYDSNGNKLVDNKQVFNDGTTYYRNEDPSSAYGGGKWFVAWEHFDTVENPGINTMDIYARTVQRSGSTLVLGSVINVCTQTNCQADPNVEFDSVNNRFCVVWEDARNGQDNYNIYGRLYDSNGSPVGDEKTISSAANSQCEPWVAFDPINQQYMIIWEDGETPNNGPFDIWMGRFDKDLNLIGSAVKLADGDADIDYNFPCVEFCAFSERYLVTWNDGDISDGDWRGNIWGRIFDSSGNTIVDNFQLSSGNYVRTDIANYLNSYFFVSYDDNSKIRGKLLSSNAEVAGNEVQLSVSSNAAADWANIGVGNNKIFVAWEDTRIDYPYPWNSMPDIYANIHYLNIPTGTSVTYSTGAEKEMILAAHITSIKIQPVNLTLWDKFNEVSARGDIVFDVLNGTTGALIVSDIQSGYNLSGLTTSSIRLKATFTRANPSTSPALDMWSVDYYINDPPNTPSNPSPANGATNVNLDVDLSWSGGDPNGDPVTYDVYFGSTNPPPQVSSNQSETTYDLGTLNHNTTYYWKIVAWDIYGATKAGPIWSFTTRINHPPNTPSNPSPANGAVNVNINADLSWTGGDPDPGDEVTYDIYFGTTSPPPILVYGHTTNSYDPGTLNQNTKYYWKIVAWDSFGESATGPIWNFTTVANNPPYAPSSPSPSNGATNVQIDTILTWTGGDPDGDPVTYNVFFGNTSTPPKVSDNQSATSYDPSGDLDFSTTYYWKIVAYDSQGANTAGPLWSFTTKANSPPTTPSSPDPANHETDVSVNIILTWSCSDPDGDELTYNVFLGKTSPPPKVSDNQSGTSYDPPGALDFSTKYYWQIIAYDEYGANTIGPIWDFTTKSNGPPTIWGRNPTDESTGIDLNADISWQGSDPDGDPVTYDVYFGTTNPPLLVMSNQTSTSFNPGQMSSNTTYYWKLVAWDDKGAFTEEPIWWFKTQEVSNTPPNSPTIYCDGEILNIFVFIKPNVEYELDFVASDLDRDDIYYFIDWGDGTSTEWLGPFETSQHILVKHTWSSNLKFGTIKAKVKDTKGAESGVTSLYFLTIKSRASNPNNIIQRILQRFILKNNLFRNLFLLLITLVKHNSKLLNTK
jgi:hypothetical protein